MKNKGFLLASSVGVAFAPGVVQAADLSAPVLKAPPPIAPVATWTGFYIGVHGGVAWEQGQNSFTGYWAAAPITTTATTGIAGGQIGYNWQQGSYVFGIEADGSWLGKGGTASASATQPAGCCGAVTYNAANQIRWLATARVRAGLAVGDTLAYI